MDLDPVFLVVAEQPRPRLGCGPRSCALRCGYVCFGDWVRCSVCGFCL